MATAGEEEMMKKRSASGSDRNNPLPYLFSNIDSPRPYSTSPSRDPEPPIVIESPPFTPSRYPKRLARRKPPKGPFSCCFGAFIDRKLDEDSVSSFRQQSFKSKNKHVEQNGSVKDTADIITPEEDQTGGDFFTAAFTKSRALAVTNHGRTETIPEEDESGSGSRTTLSDAHTQSNSLALVPHGGSNQNERTEIIPEQEQSGGDSQITQFDAQSNSLAAVPSNGSTETIPEQEQTSVVSKTALSNTNIQSNSLAVVPYDDKQVSRDESELQSMRNMAAEELYMRPKFGEIYEAITVNVEHIKKRLKDISMNGKEMGETTKKNTIDEGVEISDAASLLKLSRASTSEIEMAGLKAQRAALLMFQAQVMTNKAHELLAESKHILQTAEI